MKHIKIYDTTLTFEDEVMGINKSWVTYTRDDSKAHFMKFGVAAAWTGGGTADCILNNLENYSSESPVELYITKDLNEIKFPEEAQELISLDTANLTKVDLSKCDGNNPIIEQVRNIVSPSINVIVPIIFKQNTLVWYHDGTYAEYDINSIFKTDKTLVILETYGLTTIYPESNIPNIQNAKTIILGTKITKLNLMTKVFTAQQGNYTTSPYGKFEATINNEKSNIETIYIHPYMTYIYEKTFNSDIKVINYSPLYDNFPWGAGSYEDYTVITYSDRTQTQIYLEGQINRNDIPNILNITEIKIGYNVTSIESNTFADTNISKIYVPKTVTSIGTNAFKNISYVNYKGSATGAPWGAINIDSGKTIALYADGHSEEYELNYIKSSMNGTIPAPTTNIKNIGSVKELWIGSLVLTVDASALYSLSLEIIHLYKTTDLSTSSFLGYTSTGLLYSPIQHIYFDGTKAEYNAKYSNLRLSTTPTIHCSDGNIN